MTRRAAAVTVTVPPGPGRDAPPYKALPPLAPTKWGPRDASDLPQCIIIMIMIKPDSESEYHDYDSDLDDRLISMIRLRRRKKRRLLK